MPRDAEKKGADCVRAMYESCQTEAAYQPLRTQFAELALQIAEATDAPQAQAAITALREKLENVLAPSLEKTLLAQAREQGTAKAFGHTYNAANHPLPPWEHKGDLPKLYWNLTRLETGIDEASLPDLRKTAERCHKVLAQSKNAKDSPKNLDARLAQHAQVCNTKHPRVVLREVNDIVCANRGMLNADSLPKVFYHLSFRCKDLAQDPFMKNLMEELFTNDLPRVLPSCTLINIGNMMYSLGIFHALPKNVFHDLTEAAKTRLAGGETCNPKTAQHITKALKAQGYRDDELEHTLRAKLSPESLDTLDRNIVQARHMPRKSRHHSAVEVLRTAMYKESSPNTIVKIIEEILETRLMSIIILTQIFRLLIKKVPSNHPHLPFLIERLLRELPKILERRINARDIHDILLFLDHFHIRPPDGLVPHLLEKAELHHANVSPMNNSLLLDIALKMGHGGKILTLLPLFNRRGASYHRPSTIPEI